MCFALTSVLHLFSGIVLFLLHYFLTLPDLQIILVIYVSTWKENEMKKEKFLFQMVMGILRQLSNF